ncbi:MAG: hypothetical protein BMS9Abin21_110 [Thermodesulfovibrionia bacterium]|nr:MAG: hypothetical protein BMS9Abin21_110 [Thermodesulfovibrionia bacterium]
MPMNYKYNSKSNIVDCFPEGEISIPEITNYYMDISNNDEISNDFVEVVHLDNVTDFLFSSRSFSVVAMSFKGLLEKKRVKAIVCIGKADLHYGIGRMMQTIFELEFPEFITHVVRSEKEAQEILDNIRG